MYIVYIIYEWKKITTLNVQVENSNYYYYYIHTSKLQVWKGRIILLHTPFITSIISAIINIGFTFEIRKSSYSKHFVNLVLINEKLKVNRISLFVEIILTGLNRKIKKWNILMDKYTFWDYIILEGHK